MSQEKMKELREACNALAETCVQKMSELDNDALRGVIFNIMETMAGFEIAEKYNDRITDAAADVALIHLQYVNKSLVIGGAERMKTGFNKAAECIGKIKTYAASLAEQKSLQRAPNMSVPADTTLQAPKLSPGKS